MQPDFEQLAEEIHQQANRDRADQLHQDDDFSDDQLALGFVDMHPDFRWVQGWGRWYRWDGQRWKQDDTLHTYNDVRRFLRIIASAAQYTSKIKPSTIKSSSKVASVERLLRDDRQYAATVEQWDRNPWLLSTPGGTLDLKTGSLNPSNPDDYITRVTSVGPKGECPIWEKFLRRVTGDNDELIDFLQRSAGYSMTGTTREHVLWFLHGSGRNGKGVFMHTLQRVLGDYATTAAMGTFTETRNDRHSADLAALAGARLVVVDEIEANRRWAEARIKSITGGDKIRAQFMRQDYFEFEPQFKLWISGNHKPDFHAVDEAIKARFLLVPFTVTIPEAERDPDLEEKLRAELPGIMAWMVAGCLDYLDQGLAPPAVVREATAAYFDEQSATGLFREFVEQECTVGEGISVPGGVLYKRWTKFARENGGKPGRSNHFPQLVCETYPQVRHDKGANANFYSGIALPTQDQSW